MYVPSLILIPFVLSKIWPGQATIIKQEGHDVPEAHTCGILITATLC